MTMSDSPTDQDVHESPVANLRNRESRQPFLQQTLPGEFLSLALILHAVFGSLFWATWSLGAPQGLLMVTAGVWIVIRAIGIFARRAFAPPITIGLIFAILVSQQYVELTSPFLLFFSPTVFVAMLATVLCSDLADLLASSWGDRLLSGARSHNWYRTAIWGFGVIFLVYMVLIPTAAFVVEGHTALRPGGGLQRQNVARRAGSATQHGGDDGLYVLRAGRDHRQLSQRRSFSHAPGRVGRVSSISLSKLRNRNQRSRQRTDLWVAITQRSLPCLRGTDLVALSDRRVDHGNNLSPALLCRVDLRWSQHSGAKAQLLPRSRLGHLLYKVGFDRDLLLPLFHAMHAANLDAGGRGPSADPMVGKVVHRRNPFGVARVDARSTSGAVAGTGVRISRKLEHGVANQRLRRDLRRGARSHRMVCHPHVQSTRRALWTLHQRKHHRRRIRGLASRRRNLDHCTCAEASHILGEQPMEGEIASSHYSRMDVGILGSLGLLATAHCSMVARLRNDDGCLDRLDHWLPCSLPREQMGGDTPQCTSGHAAIAANIGGRHRNTKPMRPHELELSFVDFLWIEDSLAFNLHIAAFQIDLPSKTRAIPFMARGATNLTDFH